MDATGTAPADATGTAPVDATRTAPDPWRGPSSMSQRSRIADPVPAVPDGAAPVRHLLPEGHSLPRMIGAGVITGIVFGLAADRLTVHGHEATLLLVLP